MRGKQWFEETNWRGIARISIKVLLVLIVLPFVAVAIPQLVGASNSYVVLSNSMNDAPSPQLEAGDVIFVYDTPASAIEEGDVITFRSGEGPLTTHRVVGVAHADGDIVFQTKGDANEEADAGTVHSERVVGTVRFYLPWIGRVVAFAGTRNGLIALVILPSALLILSEIVNIGTIIRSSKDEPRIVDETPQEQASEDVHD